MDARELFLDQHAGVHSAAVGGNKVSVAERVFGGLTDAQMRVRPREDLNSVAWLMWHIARAEDLIVGQVLSGRRQVFEDGWAKRLGITRVDFGIGMTTAEVTALTAQIDVGALREYRDAVGRRTRDIVSGFESRDWDGVVTPDNARAAADTGGFGARTDELSKMFPGRPRLSLLNTIALFHSVAHMGEADTVRTAGGFGRGV